MPFSSSCSEPGAGRQRGLGWLRTLCTPTSLSSILWGSTTSFQPLPADWLGEGSGSQNTLNPLPRHRQVFHLQHDCSRCIGDTQKTCSQGEASIQYTCRKHDNQSRDATDTHGMHSTCSMNTVTRAGHSRSAAHVQTCSRPSSCAADTLQDLSNVQAAECFPMEAGTGQCLH